MKKLRIINPHLTKKLNKKNFLKIFHKLSIFLVDIEKSQINESPIKEKSIEKSAIKQIFTEEAINTSNFDEIIMKSTKFEQEKQEITNYYENMLSIFYGVLLV